MTETTQTLSLGEQLKNARQALGLSIPEVAQKTNLKKAHLEALEDDIFILSNVPPAFVRGYVRSYVRFLRLPETLVNTVNYGEVTIPKQVAKVASMPVNHSHKSQRRWVKGLTWLVLLATVGMTLTWWWQEYEKEQVMENQSVVTPNLNNGTAETTSQNSKIVPVAEQNSIATENTTVAVAQTQTEISDAQSTVPVSPIVTAEASNTETTETESTHLNVSPVPQIVEQPVLQVESEPVNILQQPLNSDSQVVEQVENQPAIVNDAELRIEITKAQSWITVRGEKNKKLAEKLYNSGEVLTFNGNEQYRLTVGAPANVKIYYKGELVPLKVDGRVARFKLPLAN